MTLSPYEPWLNLPEEWTENGLNGSLCNGRLEIAVTIANFVGNENYALLELSLEDCYRDLLIHNEIGAQRIILNLQDTQLKLIQNLEILGQSTSLTMIGSRDAFFTNITTNNIKEIFYISGIYNGFDIATNTILYDRLNAALYIDGWSSASLAISSSKVVLAGEVNPSSQLLIKIYGTDNHNYNLDTQNLKSLNTILLKISDLSKAGAGINLQGDIFGFNSFVDGNDFILANNSMVVAHKLSFIFNGTSLIYGKLHAASMIISSKGNFELKQNSEIIKRNFEGYEMAYPAPIKLQTKSNFTCEESGRIFADGRIIIKAGKNLFYNGVAQTRGDIQFEGEAIYKEVATFAKIVTHFGNIIFNNATKTPRDLIIKGIVAAEQGVIKYIIGNNFRTDGITAGAMGIIITSLDSNSSNILINKVDELVEKRWQEAISSNVQIVASLISLANKVTIDANIIMLNDGAIILNLADLSLGNAEAGRVVIKANSYIHHKASNITANAAILEDAYGRSSEGFGIIFANSAHAESRFGEINITSTQNIKLEGNITSGTSVYLSAACLQNSRESAIHSLQGDVRIDLAKCQFNNLGIISSNASLVITTNGGDVENYNILAADDMKITVHGQKNFINSGSIFSNNNVRIGLEIFSKIFLKPESLIYVGSYNFGHFSDSVRLRISEVQCHGCSIHTIKPTTSIISASVASVRITHYEKTDYRAIDHKRFTTNTWKETKKILGIVVDVKHKESHTTLALLENHHNYYGPAINQHTGDVIYDVGYFNIIMSSVIIGGTAHFPSPTTLKITSEQAERRIVADRGSFTHMNTLSNVQNAFALNLADIKHQHGAVIISKATDVVNSVFFARNGIEGHFRKIELGSARSTTNANSLLPSAAISALKNQAITDIMIDSASKDKTVIFYNWKSSVNQLETITHEYLQAHGFDVSKLIHPSMLNPNIWGHISSTDQPKLVAPDKENELNLQPIFFLKNDPLLAPFIHSPLNLVHFLASLAFNEKGLVYTIGDEHFIAKLVDQAIFTFLGVLTGVNNAKLLNTLALNAKYEQGQQGLVVGMPLTLEQTQKLKNSIIWPVWLDNCIKSIKCLDFRLYFNTEALEKSLSGAIMASDGKIDIKVLGNVLVRLTGQIKSGESIKFDLQGNFVNLGLITSIKGTTISAKNIGNAGKFNIGQGNLTLDAVYDIINIGTSLVKEGNVHLKAGHDIKELILINPANPVPYLTKRAIYAIGGSLYYEAANDINQQASVIFASGNVTMIAGHDIKIEAFHQSRIVKEERSRKHYLIQSTIDQYDAIIMVEGTIMMNAGNNFIGSGIKLSSNSSDINIVADNRAIFEDRTSYAWNYQGATKTKFLGKSQVSVSWTTDQTANIEITAPGGKIYVSSKECTLEGGIFNGQKPIFKCDKLEIKPHKVIKKVETVISQSGLFKPNVPLIELMQSKQPEKHLLQHTIVGSINSLIKMQGPLDLLPAVNLISSIPRLKADYNLLSGGKDGFSSAALFGALLSKYISASISFGNKETTTSATQTTAALTQISGQECVFAGKDGSIAANVDCKNSITMEFDNLKLTGAKNILQVNSVAESSSVDIGVSLNGVSFGVSFSQGNFQQEQVLHNSGISYSKNINIKVNHNFEIENAQINGKNVTVDALGVEINQVIDSSRLSSHSSGGSLGVTVGWAGTITPTASAEYAESLKQSQVVQLISGISGETVEVTAKNLAYNIISITAEKYLSIIAENIDYIALPQTEDIDTEFHAAASISPRPDGKSTHSASLYSRDGNKVMSVGYSSAFAEGLSEIREFLASDTSKLKEHVNVKQQDFGVSEDVPGQSKDKVRSQEQAADNDKDSFNKKIDLPSHLAKLYNEIIDKADAMSISAAEKDNIKNQIYDNLKKASSSSAEDQMIYMKEVFAFQSDPMIWIEKNLYSKRESVKNVQSVNEALAEFNIEAEKYEAAKSPEAKAREAQELKRYQAAILEDSREWMKKDAAAQRQEAEEKIAKEYIADKITGELVEVGMAIGSLFIPEVFIPAIIINRVMTAGDDKLEMITKMRDYDNQPADGNYPH